MKLKIVYAGIGAGLVMWVVAGLWHNLILPSLYAERHGAHEGIGILLVAYVILGGFMSGLTAWGRPAGYGLWRSMLFGAVIGVLWVFPHELAMAGAHGDALVYVLKNATWHAVEQAFGGAVIGMVLRRRSGA